MRILEQHESISQKPSAKLVEYGDRLGRLLWVRLRHSLSAEQQEMAMTAMRLAVYADRLIPKEVDKPMGPSSQEDLSDAIEIAIKYLSEPEKSN